MVCWNAGDRPVLTSHGRLRTFIESGTIELRGRSFNYALLLDGGKSTALIQELLIVGKLQRNLSMARIVNGS